MKRFLTSSFFVVMALMMTIASAGAGRGWCRADPIVSFNGTPVQIWLEMPDEYQHLVTGPIDFTIHHPWDVEAKVLFTDDGFNGHGEDIRFSEVLWGTSDTLVGDVDEAAYYGYDYFWGAGNGSFPIEFVASVPFHKGKLRKEFGLRSDEVPLRLIIIDPAGVEHVVEGTNDGTRITVHIDPTVSTS